MKQESDVNEKRVIGARREPCAASERQHSSALAIDDGSLLYSSDVIALIDAGAVFSMKPPPGAPAHAAHAATGLDLIVQVVECPECGKKVLFA